MTAAAFAIAGARGRSTEVEREASAGSAGRVMALHVFGWIVDSGLRDSLKALAHSLLRRVDSNSFRWPRRHGTPGGVTVADLADGAGISRRHTARCLRVLEELGLVRTLFRPFDVSEYELVPDAWRSRAEQHRSARQAALDKSRSERIAAFNARRAAALGRPMPVVAPSPSPAPAEEPAAAPIPRPAAPALPGWALRHARRLKERPETIFSLVGGAGAAVLGPKADPVAQGGLARPVLRLWDGRGRPDPDDLLHELSLVAAWAQASVHPEAIALRGRDRRGDGLDRSRDARHLCDPARFEQRLELARAHERAIRRDTGQGGGADPASGPPPGLAKLPEPPIPRRGDPPWIPPGQPTFLPGIGPRAESLVDAWRAALHRLRGSEEHDRGAIDIFLSPLRPVGLREGVVVMGAPSEDCARWIGRHLTNELAELAQAMGAPLGLVYDPGPAGGADSPL